MDVEHTWLCADSVLRDYWSNVGLWQVINIQNVLVCINMSVYTIHWPYLYQYQCYVCMDIEHKWLVRARIPHNADIISEIIPHNHCNYAPSTTINSVARQIQDIVHRGHWRRKISFEESFFLAVGWLYLRQTVNVLTRITYVTKNTYFAEWETTNRSIIKFLAAKNMQGL